MICCQDLTVRYGEYHALNGLNLVIEPHSTCSVIGRSGSGKTTLLHALSGLRKPDAGTVQIGGERVTDVRRGTSIVLQERGLFPWKTVGQQLQLALENHHDSSEVRIRTVLEELEIGRHIHKYPRELSEGERQRSAIARAIVTQPDVLIMDEPTSALDAITKEAIQQQILKLHHQYGMTLILVTHDIEEAVFLGRKVVVMNHGQIIREVDNPRFGSPERRKELGFYEQCIALREVLNP